MTIRFGVSPIAWINDDMPELGGDTPLETVLGDAQQTGFKGIELGGKFPRAAPALKALLDRFGLALVGGRSEEHTSELQSLMRISYAVFCLKKKQQNHLTPRARPND